LSSGPDWTFSGTNLKSMNASLKKSFARLAGLGLLALVAVTSQVQAQAPFTLFGTTNDVVNFRSVGGGVVPWTLTSSNSILVVPGTGNIQSTQTYGDFILHAEFLLPATGNGNCGIFLQGRYEVQIFNSFNKTGLDSNDCGAIYGQVPPAANACLAPGVWQTYDIIFRQPRWSGNTKLANARATVVLNGVTVQNDVVITNSTSATTAPEGPTLGPLTLQDNGSDVELRNIQILPLSPTATLINGSFEMSPITANIVLTNGSTLVSGWSVGSTGPLSFVTGPSFGVPPLDGNQMLEFNSGNTLAGDTVSQTFPTTPGQSYVVSFNVARTPAGTGGSVSLRGSVTSATGQTLGTLDGFAPSSGWSAAQTFSFAATTPTSTLTFLDTSLATVAVDALLDNVSVSIAAANPTNTIVYDLVARMDGSQDTLIFQDATLQWNHVANGSAAPGRALGRNDPTLISSSLNGTQMMNQVAWIPTWPQPVPNEIRFDAVSSVFTNLTPVLPAGGILSVSVTNISARGSLSVVQLPSAANGNTLIVNYADAAIGSGFVTGRVTVVSLAIPPGPPGIAQPPANLRVVPGTNVTFSVGVSGPGPFTYLWRQNGINIPGATGPTLSLTNVQTANNGAYTVLIGNAYGSVTGIGSLEVLTAPAITTQPLGTTNLAGDSVTFSVEATGSTPLLYQWRLNGVNVPGAVASTLTLDAVAVTSAGLYSVVVSNAAGVAVSSNAMLAVSSAPVIITPPAARIVNATAPVSFTVAALGDAPFTYQWRLNGTNLVGATSATFSIGAATPSHEGLYSVVVGNALGSATSSAARLTVLPVSVVVPWAAGSGGSGSDVGNAIAVDAAGNSYVAGYFTGTATFGTNTLVSAGNTDIFIAKHGSNGQLLWVRRAGGPGYDAARGIAVDAAGNCHVTGAYEGEAAFGTTTLTNTSPTSYADAFLAKFDTAGTLVWARSAGVEFTHDEGAAVALDGAGNVLVTGRSVLDTFAGGPVANPGRIFVAKYDSAGTEVWARKAGSYSGGNLDTGTGIATDSAGNVFVGGVFYSPVAAFGAGSFTNLGNADVFLAKFDAAGTLQWARQAGGSGEDTAGGVAVAADGSAYLVGALGGNANFSGSNVTSLAGAASDGFVAKFAPGGGVTWVRQLGGNGLSAARAVAVDAAGTVHVTGYFSGGAVFGTNTLGGISGSYDAFLTRLDPNGVFAFAQQAGGADLSGDFGLGVGADAAGNSFITGYFSGTSSIGGGSLPSQGGEDVLVTRFNQFTGGGQPQLGLQRNGAQFRMRWPLASSSYVLQSTTNLLAPVWRDETNALTLNGTELETDVTPGSALKFYRLRKP